MKIMGTKKRTASPRILSQALRQTPRQTLLRMRTIPLLKILHEKIGGENTPPVGMNGIKEGKILLNQKLPKVVVTIMPIGT